LGLDAMGKVFLSWENGAWPEESVCLFSPDTIINIGDGLPNSQVNMLTCNPWMSVIHIFTCTGSGVYYCYDYLTDIQEKYNSEIKIYPNPVKVGGQIHINCSIPHEFQEVLLYNISGKVFSINSYQDSFSKQIFLETKHLNPGIYILKFCSTDFEISRKIIVTE
jgi:hypothetical protein